MGLLPGARQRASAALLFAAFASTALMTAGCGGSKPIAQVNGQALSEKEFHQLCESTTRLDPQKGTTVGMQTLTQWIASTVMAQEAKKQGVYPSQKEVDSRLDAYRRQSAVAGSSLDEQMKMRGLTLEAMKRDLVAQLVTENVMLHGVIVSDAELQTAWEKQKEMFVQPEQVEISQITVDSPDDAKKVQSDLAGNADFALVARTRSKDQFKDHSGRIPVPLGKRLQPGMPVTQEAVNAAFKMKPGQISDPIKVGATWVVVRLENKIEEKQPKLEDFAEPMRVQLRQQKAQQSGELQKNQQAVQKAQQGAKVEINRPEYQSLLTQRNSPGGPAGAPGPAGEGMPPAPPGD